MYPMLCLSNCARKTELRNSKEVTDPRSFSIRTMVPQVFLNERKLQPKSSFKFESDNAGMLPNMHMFVIMIKQVKQNVWMYFRFRANVPFWVLCFRVLRIPDTAMHREKEGDINLSNATTLLTGVRHLARALLKGDGVTWSRAKH